MRTIAFGIALGVIAFGVIVRQIVQVLVENVKLFP